MNYYWAMLNIAPTSDLKAIKRAYATQLKAHRPEDNAEHFQRLREAYEWACQIGVHCLDEYDEYDEYEDASESDARVAATPENADANPIIAQVIPELALILPSVPTHFPITFEPPPSPTFPPLAQHPLPAAAAPEPNPFAVRPLPEAAVPANAAYVPITHSTVRMRSMAQVLPWQHVQHQQMLAEFWAQSQQLKTIPEIQHWLQAQAEYESLQMRPHLEAALADAFTEQPWPWAAVLAVAELLDWGTIGNLVHNELNQAVQLAQFQQRAAVTRKPRWHQLFSKSAAAHFLLTPFSWPQALLSALLPRTQQINELCDEVARSVDPSLVFNPQQIEFQRKLRQVDFNLPRIAYALTRLIGWPLLFSLLFIALDWVAPLVGLAFGVAGFALWACHVANRLLFRTIWTPSRSSTGTKIFWLGIGATIAIASISAAFAWPNFAVLLAGFMLLAVAQNFATAFVSGAFGAIVAMVSAAVIWPMHASEKFSLTITVALSVVSMCVFAYQRRVPTEKLLESLITPPARLKPVAAPGAGNFNWWWIIAAIALMRLFATGH